MSRAIPTPKSPPLHPGSSPPDQPLFPATAKAMAPKQKLRKTASKPTPATPGVRGGLSADDRRRYKQDHNLVSAVAVDLACAVVPKYCKPFAVSTTRIAAEANARREKRNVGNGRRFTRYYVESLLQGDSLKRLLVKARGKMEHTRPVRGRKLVCPNTVRTNKPRQRGHKHHHSPRASQRANALCHDTVLSVLRARGNPVTINATRRCAESASNTSQK